MENQSVEDTKLFFHYNNAKKCFDTVVSENEPEGNASLVGLTIEDAAGINEYDNPTDASENFVKAKKILADVDIETIAKTCKAITLFVNNLQPGVSCVCEKDNRYSAIQDVKKCSMSETLFSQTRDALNVANVYT